MICVSHAMSLAKLYGFESRIEDNRLHVWKDDILNPRVIISFSTVITDDMVAEMMLERFMKEYGEDKWKAQITE